MKASIKFFALAAMFLHDVPMAGAAEPLAACPVLGDPVTAIEATDYYDRSDDSYSKIDIERFKLNQKLVKPVNDFLNSISELSDQYVLTRSESVKRCSDEIIFKWAKAKSLMDVSYGTQARFIQQWAASTLAFSRMKLGPLKSPRHDSVVTEWMNEIAWSVNSFQKGDGGSRRQNHYYWSMLGIGAIGLATNDRDLLWRSEEMFNIAIGDIEPNGTIAAELKRGQRASLYHAFAAQPLAIHTMLRERCISQRDDETPQLDKLLRLVRAEIAGSQVIDGIVGVRQTEVGKQEWLMLWDAVQANSPQSAGTLKSRNLAGRMDTLATVIVNDCRSSPLSPARPVPSRSSRVSG